MYKIYLTGTMSTWLKLMADNPESRYHISPEMGDGFVGFFYSRDEAVKHANGRNIHELEIYPV